MDSDAKLLEYFMRETHRRFEELAAQARDTARAQNEAMAEVKDKLDDLGKFKIEMMVSARTTAMLVSGLCGMLTLASSLALVYFTARPQK